MKNKLLILSTLVLGSISATPLLAQNTMAPATRAEVKSEIPANRTKDSVPTLERTTPKAKQTPPASGDNQPKTRDEVRAETSNARQTGELANKGDTDKPKMETKKEGKPMHRPTKEERAEARADRLPEAKAAAKNPDPTGGVYNPAKKASTPQ